MQILKSVEELSSFVHIRLSQGKTIGFVPTMGALHKGHISLIARSLKENDFSIASVFVNPSQFNDPKDFSKYPRQLEKDAEMLEKAGADALFAPPVEAMYPEPDTVKYNLSPVDDVLEGAFRPGHFNGVASVVKRLLEIVRPTRAYFGLKDYQQYLVVKTLVERYHLTADIVGCEIIREPSGLAMSSRNQLLSDEGKKIAASLSAALQQVKARVGSEDILSLQDYGRNFLNGVKGLELEYFEIVHLETLLPFMPATSSSGQASIALVAARVEGVRLIDNMFL
jgi:pantoate--beta-alanine ligase